jgi:murein DD-endopeptidase MepM/ murein hydrolase activator NlpD
MSYPVHPARVPTRRLLRRSAALGVVLAFLFPALGQAASPAGSNDAAQLEQTRRDLAAIQKKLTESRGQAAQIQSQVQALDRQINALDRQVGVDTKAVLDLESNIRTDQARIDQLQAQYRGAQQAADSRARSIYMGGAASTLSTLLSASSLGDFIRKTVLWQIAAKLDSRVILTSARLRDSLSVERDDLTRSTEALRAKQGTLASRADLLANARSQQKAALAAVQAQIADELEAEAELQKQSEQLTAALQADAQISHSTGPVSASGLVWPVRGPVVSPFGPRGRGFHYGIDIAAPTGTPIVAAKDGTIAGISCGTGYGICTIIDHGNGVTTLYAHMSRKGISAGHVNQGEVIGYVGCTGFCTGPHLHFEVRINGSPNNPRQYL